MPRTIDEGFRDFLNRLTPSSTETQAAKGHRASIEACLKANFSMNRFFRIGSFGNGTSISGYSDVDFLAGIPTEKLKANSSTTLGQVRVALETRFPNTGVYVDSPAIVVPFGKDGCETTEVVPADYVTENDGYAVYEIADGAGGWRRASPDAHNAYVRWVDGERSNKANPLVRFIKAWKYFRNVPISSFYLEMRVAKYAIGEKTIVYEHDVRNVLKLLLDNGLADMQDPMKVSGNISACSSDAKREDALSKLKTAYARADKALSCSANGKVSEAFDWWRQLYDNRFPTYNY